MEKMKRKPSELEIKAREMVEVFSKKATLDELKEQIITDALAMSPELNIMMILIEKKDDGYHSTIYVSREDLKRKYPG